MRLRRERLTTCDRVSLLLPAVAEGTLPVWRRRFVDRHLVDCDDCPVELERQWRVAEGIEGLREVERSAAEVAPPEGLLDTLLEQAQDPGLRARAAVPVRGAISGARPGLSVTFGLGTLALIALAAWAGWRLGSRFAEAREHRRPPLSAR